MKFLVQTYNGVIDFAPIQIFRANIFHENFWC